MKNSLNDKETQGDVNSLEQNKLIENICINYL